MFKKVKKNFRSRIALSDDEEETFKSKGDGVSSNSSDFSSSKKKSTKNKSAENKNTKTKSKLLSFADDEEETEIFQVKKSSHSKRLGKMMDREKRAKKIQELENTTNIINKAAPIVEDIGIIVKKDEEKAAREKLLILNGRAALMAGKDDVSSSEDEGSARFKFSRPLRDEITIESGTIPDAATIHAARKRRERARQMNLDFVPLEKNNTKEKRGGTSRLVREEDDGSDDERIKMGTGLETNDLESRRENYYEHVDAIGEIEDTDASSAWNTQAVSAIQGAAVSINNEVDVTSIHSLTALHPPPPPNIQPSRDLATPESLVQRLRDRIIGLKEIHAQHCRDVVRVDTELEENRTEVARLVDEAPSLADRFRFYQDLRGYVTDLVECLDEKVPGLVKMEEGALKLWSDRAAFFYGRRRLDIRDQADEMTSNAKAIGARWTPDEEEARGRRAAEREGRRTRRRRARELRSIPPACHIDGMSSDDEEPDQELNQFTKKREDLMQEANLLFDDVELEFGTIDGITKRIESWRDFDRTAYVEAYASICIPKIIGPFVRLHLMLWNPLMSGCPDLDTLPWWSRLLFFGFKEDETQQTLSQDSDLLLVPIILEKAVLPKLIGLVKNSWDPMSSSQTLKLIGVFSKYISSDMPKMEYTSLHVKQLLEAIIDRFQHAIDNDIFIPLNYSQLESKGATTVFFQRQFASAVKLLRNIISFQGIISFQQLQSIALDGLLNKYLLTAMRLCQPRDAALKANIIVNTFPRWWFQTGTQIVKLEMFTKQLKHIGSLLQPNHPLDKESFETVSTLLKTLELSCSTIV